MLPDLIEFIEPTTLIICLCVGYVIKNTKPFEPIANDFIPLIECVLGVLCVGVGALIGGEQVTLPLIATGFMTGIASVGLHQLFTRTVGAMSGEE